MEFDWGDWKNVAEQSKAALKNNRMQIALNEHVLALATREMLKLERAGRAPKDARVARVAQQREETKEQADKTAAPAADMSATEQGSGGDEV